MADINIIKFNNSFARITSSDKGILRSLADGISRYVKDYIFQPKYKAGIWDGKIRYFNAKTGLILLGLVGKVLEFAKSHNYSISIDPDVQKSFNCEKFSKEQISQYAIDLLPSDGNGSQLEWRDYQIDAIATCVTRKRRLIMSPTSSGKSLIMYGACRFLIDNVLMKNEKILIVVPTLSLIKQMRTDFIEYSKINKWAAYDHTTEYWGSIKDTSGKIVVSTWQSLYKKEKSFFDQFRVLFVDEAHGAASTSLVEIAGNCNAEYRIGMSGSFVNDDEATELTLNGIFGNRTKTISTREMIDRNFASDLEIKAIHLTYQDKEFVKMDYAREQSVLAKLDERNTFILDTADSVKGNVLILFNLVEAQGKPLYERAKTYCKKKVFFIYGGIDVDDREQIRKICETRSDAIILASYKCFSTGNNLKNLETIIFGSTTKSFTRVIQSIGRGLRLNSGKTHCTLYDLFDELYYTKKTDAKSYNYSFKHFLARAKIYKEEQHKVEIIKKSLPCAA